MTSALDLASTVTECSASESAFDAKPLVTFALVAYNQEQFIRDAVDGALLQTYSPLEVILSDDRSTDRTYEIIEEVAASYSGPHRVITRRSSVNLGLAGHINAVMSVANGELVVAAAGDDVSLPNRVSVNVQHYLIHGKPDSLFSDYIDIDAAGDIIEARREPPPFHQDLESFVDDPRIKGAAHSWTRRLFTTFGPMTDETLCEDQVLPFRAYLLRPPHYIDERLVKYRRVTQSPRGEPSTSPSTGGRPPRPRAGSGTCAASECRTPRWRPDSGAGWSGTKPIWPSGSLKAGGSFGRGVSWRHGWVFVALGQSWVGECDISAIDVQTSMLEPAVSGGVHDYCTTLASVLSWEVIRVTHSDAGQAAWPERLLVHYSGYGYSRRGAPLWLLRELESRRPSLHTLGIWFHEVHASGPPWSSAFWLSPAQRHIARRLAELSDFWIANLGLSAEWLTQGAGYRPHAVLPVCSNVGEEPELRAERSPAIVILGGAPVRTATYRDIG